MIVVENDDLVLQRHLVDGPARWVEELARERIVAGCALDSVELLWLRAEHEAGGLLPCIAPEGEDVILRTSAIPSGRLDATAAQRDYGAMRDSGVIG